MLGSCRRGVRIVGPRVLVARMLCTGLLAWGPRIGCWYRGVVARALRRELPDTEAKEC